MEIKKKLIEVALPLDAINKASAREKSIRHGHPSTLHLWWARRPLAAARAVIFTQMVDDPSGYVNVLLSDTKKRRAAEREFKKRIAGQAAKRSLAPDDAIIEPEPTLEEIIAEQERNRLFAIIEELVLWENTTNEEVLERARREIWQSWRRACAENAAHPRATEIFDRHKLPAFHDPFAGGGALPLEAQRLGLEAHASDLNPVAVLINKAMIEIPPKFAGQAPVNPEWRSKSKGEQTLATWRGAQGLAEDVRCYGQWMRDQAEKRIGHLYPKIEVTTDMAKERPDLERYRGRKLTVIAWLWARTVKSPNPAFADVEVPLASTFMLSTKKGKEAYVEPVIEDCRYRFTVKVGMPRDAAAKAGTKLSRGANFRCLMSGTPITGDYIKAEGQAGRMGARLMAIVAEGDRGRVYLAPAAEHEKVAHCEKPASHADVPTQELPIDDTANFWCTLYGLTTFADLFTSRQLVALTTFSDLVTEAIEQVQRDARAVSLAADGRPLRDGGTGATAYAEAVGVYLGLSVSRQANRSSNLNFWDPLGAKIQQVFARQALPMVWDFVESNPFSDSSGSFVGQVRYLSKVVSLSPRGVRSATAAQHDAMVQCLTDNKLVSTDPPYYDNIGYADLSDFFYVWLRKSLRPIFPDLFDTMAVPKAEELVATPYRHEDKEKAERFFLAGMTAAMRRLAEQAHSDFPVTIYYAFKQSEKKGDEGTSSTGWETFLDAVIEVGFSVTGTWPMRTEYTGNLKKNISSLASSIVLVCRQRPADAPMATRREFVTALKTKLPVALAHLQRGNIAPVDLAQAAIGPGMAVYTRYAKVLDAEGNALPVREALVLINQTLDEVLAQQEGDFDADSRWALAWFEQFGFDEGEYGIAEMLSKAKNTSVAGMVEAGILASKGGTVRLLRPKELPPDWDPTTDPRLTAWEMVHHLVQALEAGGESAAAELAAQLGAKAEAARELCYRLYTLCERKKRTAAALSYNSLVQSWPEITRLAREEQKPEAEQTSLFASEDT